MSDPAVRAGMSQAMVSTIETGRTTPSMSTLFRLADGLGIRARELLPVEQQQVRVIRSGADVAFHSTEDEASTGVQGRLLVLGSSLMMEVIEYRMEPGYRRGPFKHPGEEFVRVLEGSLQVELDANGEAITETLMVGDMLHHNAEMTHSWTAVGSGPTLVLLVGASPHDHTDSGRP
jgi:quercetin dioxygenase-like cupin family protein